MFRRKDTCTEPSEKVTVTRTKPVTGAHPSEAAAGGCTVGAGPPAAADPARKPPCRRTVRMAARNLFLFLFSKLRFFFLPS